MFFWRRRVLQDIISSMHVLFNLFTLHCPHRIANHNESEHQMRKFTWFEVIKFVGVMLQGGKWFIHIAMDDLEEIKFILDDAGNDRDAIPVIHVGPLPHPCPIGPEHSAYTWAFASWVTCRVENWLNISSTDRDFLDAKCSDLVMDEEWLDLPSVSSLRDKVVGMVLFQFEGCKNNFPVLSPEHRLFIHSIGQAQDCYFFKCIDAFHFLVTDQPTALVEGTNKNKNQYDSVNLYEQNARDMFEKTVRTRNGQLQKCSDAFQAWVVRHGVQDVYPTGCLQLPHPVPLLCVHFQ